MVQRVIMREGRSCHMGDVALVPTAARNVIETVLR
jgi:hypothetical protein